MNDVIRTYAEQFHREHEEWYRGAIPDSEAAAWMEENVPHFSCDDKEIEEIYYYRWWTYRKHIVKTALGWAVTEFLPDVPWSGPDNVIVCPVGHQINEGRWLRDKAVIRDYIRRYLRDDENFENGLKYSNPLIYTAYEFCMAENDKDFASEIFPGLERVYAAWKERQQTVCGLYWSNDGRDGMEFSISGSGLRPTLNAYMYGAAYGMAALAAYTGLGDREYYEREAAALKEHINSLLWDKTDGFYKTIPMDTMEDKPDFSRADPDRNCREQIGFLPFTYPGLAEKDQESAYRYLCREEYFRAPFGITTADKTHPLFMKNPVRHECLWDGPVWPFATSGTLTGLYSLLSRADSTEADAGLYMTLLKQYAASHVLWEGGKRIHWIDENQEPFTGRWIARELIRLDHIYADKFPPERGADYNHSTFCDLVLSGACGIKFTADSLTVKPLAVCGWKHFDVTNLSIRGKTYEVHYDASASPKLCVFENGSLLASGTDCLTIKL